MMYHTNILSEMMNVILYIRAEPFNINIVRVINTWAIISSEMSVYLSVQLIYRDRSL